MKEQFSINYSKEVESILNQIEASYHARVDDVKHAIKLAKNALEKSKQINYQEGKAKASVKLALYHMIVGHNEDALDYATTALSFFKTNHDLEGQSEAWYTIGSVQYKTTNHRKGLESLMTCLNLQELSDDLQGQSKTLKAIGYIQETFGDFTKAIDTYERCIQISTKIGDKNGVSNACNPLSGIYLKQNNFKKAMELIDLSIKLKKQTGDTRGIAFAYYGKGKIYGTIGENHHAIKFYELAKGIHEKVGEKLGLGLVYTNLGIVYGNEQKFEVANDYLKKALDVADLMNNNDIRFKAYYNLYLIEKRQGNTENALDYYVLFHENKERALSIESKGKIQTIEDSYKAEILRKEAEIQRIRNQELKNAHEEIANKNKQITDSIEYAKLIQEAILPSTELLDEYFSAHFIYFLPKDIVSGDFYWIGEANEKLVIAVADCIGHGVPGAFMSMIGNDLLNSIILEKKITDPAKILDKMRQGIINALHQNEKGNESKDGIDIAIAVYDQKLKKIDFAGALINMLILRNGHLNVIQANKFPVGRHVTKELQPFTNHKLDLREGDTIYFYSDGYPDQFGGLRGKKFKNKYFKELLVSMNGSSIEKQGEILKKTFVDWKGNEEQVDDVLVLGIKV